MAEFNERWCKIFGARDKFRETLNLNDDRYLELRYESLVQKPVEKTRQLFKFLEEEWEESVARFSGTQEDFNKVLAVTGKASTILERMKQPLTSGRIGIWKRVLTVDDIECLHAAAEQALLDAFRKVEKATPPYTRVKVSR